MIDDKKIDIAARQYAEEAFVSEVWQACYKEGFKDCAKWMQKEFLKDLWHPASEEPRKKAMLLIEISPLKPTLKKFYYTDIFIGEDWEITCSTMSISRWLYVDDLISKI